METGTTVCVSVWCLCVHATCQKSYLDKMMFVWTHTALYMLTDFNISWHKSGFSLAIDNWGSFGPPYF